MSIWLVSNCSNYYNWRKTCKKYSSCLRKWFEQPISRDMNTVVQYYFIEILLLMASRSHSHQQSTTIEKFWLLIINLDGCWLNVPFWVLIQNIRKTFRGYCINRSITNVYTLCLKAVSFEFGNIIWQALYSDVSYLRFYFCWFYFYDFFIVLVL